MFPEANSIQPLTRLARGFFLNFVVPKEKVKNYGKIFIKTILGEPIFTSSRPSQAD